MLLRELPLEQQLAGVPGVVVLRGPVLAPAERKLTLLRSRKAPAHQQPLWLPVQEQLRAQLLAQVLER